MQNSQEYFAGQRQDYVLTSTTNKLPIDNDYLEPLSPSYYQLNYKTAFLDAEHVLSNSPKMNYEIHDVTPHPMNLSQISLKKKESLRFGSDNKQNISGNFDLFEPLEYEKLFDKKIDLSRLGLSSNKKNPLSEASENKSNVSLNQSNRSRDPMSSSKQSKKSISELSNESKRLIQRSINKKIDQNSSESKDSISEQSKDPQFNYLTEKELNQSLKAEMRLLQLDFKQVDSIPVTSSNETIQTKQNQNSSEPLSSGHQQNTYSTRQVNLRSIEQAQDHENQREDGSQVPSFNEKQQVLDYFLTQQDDPSEHNNSEEGIQLLSELQSELNSLINGSAQNSRTSSNSLSKQGKALHEIRSFGVRSNPESAISKRCKNACEQLASKIQELKLNIFILHQKISNPSDKTEKILETYQSTHGLTPTTQDFKKIPFQTKKSPQIILSKLSEEKCSNKLIYPDSQIIFSKNDTQFVEFNDEFSKILDQSFNLPNSKNHHSNPEIFPQSIPIPSSESKSKKQMIQSKIDITSRKSESKSQIKSNQISAHKFDTSDKKMSMRIELEKQVFMLQKPKFYNLENQNDQSNNPVKSQSIDLGNSSLSSTSNEAFMLNELHQKFTSKFKNFFQTEN